MLILLTCRLASKLRQAHNFFADNNICMVWSQLAELRSTPPISTTDFLYLRFIDDRTIDEKDFGRIQKKDRVMEMKKWTSRVKSYQGRRKKKKYQSCHSIS